MSDSKFNIADEQTWTGCASLLIIRRIVGTKYQQGPAHNRQHPFIEVLFADITESGEAFDLNELVRDIGRNNAGQP